MVSPDQAAPPGAATTGRDKDGSPDGRAGLVDLLLAALQALAAAGQTETACRLAGRACAALRRRDPAQWRRFNALLHRLTRSSP
jgi:hypothetical protein